MQKARYCLDYDEKTQIVPSFQWENKILPNFQCENTRYCPDLLTTKRYIFFFLEMTIIFCLQKRLANLHTTLEQLFIYGLVMEYKNEEFLHIHEETRT